MVKRSETGYLKRRADTTCAFHPTDTSSHNSSMTKPTSTLLACLCGLAVLMPSTGRAQPKTDDNKSVDEMVQQLQQPRTRSLRNLVVTPAAPEGNAAAPAPPAAAGAAPGAAAPGTGGAAAAVASPSPAAGQASAGTPAGGAMVDDGAALNLNILFALGSAEVSAASKATLAKVAQALGSASLLSARFRIEGHTDATGSVDGNLRLSKARAEAVKALLVSGGVAPDRLDAQGFGSSRLANPKEPASGENRRVRVVNLQ
jgi:outer membrane protein OmpA-like peptidoglycan-associated protein